MKNWDRATLIAGFEPSDIHSANARFDMTKCTWFNAQYLRELSPEALFSAVLPFLENAGLKITDPAMAAKAVYSIREKVSLLGEIPSWVHYFFTEDYRYEPDAITKLKAKPENAQLLTELKSALHLSEGQFDEHSAHDTVDLCAQKLGVKAGALMPLLRFALTGQTRGPGVATIIELLGSARTVARIERTLGVMQG